MISKSVFVPRILLCGDEMEFILRVGQRPFKIVGHVQFRGETNGQKFDFAQDGKLLLNDKILNAVELSKMIRRGGFDFIVFNSYHELVLLDEPLTKLGCLRGYGIPTTEFDRRPTDNLHYLEADMKLMDLLQTLSIKTLLDVDSYIANSLLLTKCSNDLTEIDCICDKELFPMKGEIFHHVYKNFSECHLRHYDAALISENTPADFDNAFRLLKDTADLVVTFAQNGSELAKHIQSNKDKFKKVDVYPAIPSGQWIFCYRQASPQDFAMYVVTHKLLPPEHIKLFPDKYKVINAGAALRDDLGYIRDDTGENISELNPYINEVTTFYWIWKNTSHTVVGVCHYRRFFQLKAGGNFLTEEEALDFFKEHDVLIRTIRLNRGNFFRKHDALHRLIVDIVRKNLARTYPDYLDAFDYKMNSSVIYFNNSFVMRKNIFDAYCEWLFSFMLDSLKEILKEFPRLGRTVGYFCEAMLTVWLMKNNLRVKELRLIFKQP